MLSLHKWKEGFPIIQSHGMWVCTSSFTVYNPEMVTKVERGKYQCQYGDQRMGKKKKRMGK